MVLKGRRAREAAGYIFEVTARDGAVSFCRMLRNSGSGPEIGFPGRISAAFKSGELFLFFVGGGQDARRANLPPKRKHCRTLPTPPNKSFQTLPKAPHPPKTQGVFLISQNTPKTFPRRLPQNTPKTSPKSLPKTQGGGWGGFKTCGAVCSEVGVRPRAVRRQQKRESTQHFVACMSPNPINL